ARRAVSGLPAEFERIAKTEWSNAWQQKLVAAASEVLPLLEALEEARKGLASATGLQFPLESAEGMKRALSLVQAILECRGHDMRFAFAADFAEDAADARRAMALVVDYRVEERALSARYAPEAA